MRLNFLVATAKAWRASQFSTFIANVSLLRSPFVCKVRFDSKHLNFMLTQVFKDA